MMSRLLLSLLPALALTSCDPCVDYGCISGFGWNALVPAEWPAEEVEQGVVRLCVNGACEEKPVQPRDLRLEDDGSLRLVLSWEVTEAEKVDLADGDLVSLTLLTTDGRTIMGVAEMAVTYEVVEGICDVGYCSSVDFEGSTL